MNYTEIVYGFKTKYEHGFIQSEIDELLSNYPNANLEKFNNALFGCTYEIIDGNGVMYKSDILSAFRCAIENRGLRNYEWD